MSPQLGRPRNASIDAALAAAMLDELALSGYDGASLARVAATAGTTRQALYRRFRSKADLATAAISTLRRPEERTPTDAPRLDLERELEAFRSGVSRPNGMALIGTMLQTGVDPELAHLFRERIVQPRRSALASILRRMAPAADERDVEHLVSMLTGSWYAYALAGRTPPGDWPARSADLAARLLGS